MIFVTKVGLAALPCGASAQQDYPTKPIRIVIGGTPGSSTDTVARLISAKMSNKWGKPVVVDNRPYLAAHIVSKAVPDGYTLLIESPTLAIRAAIDHTSPSDGIKDFAGVTTIGNSNTVIVVPSPIGVKSIEAFAAFAKNHTGKIFFATPAAGTVDHLNAERFRLALGIKAQHVSFKGAPESLIEVAAGRAQFTAAGMTAALPLIKDSKVFALVQRIAMLPDVPVAADVLPEWKQIGGTSMLAPAGTPLSVRQMLGQEIARILSLPDVRERLAAVAYHVELSTPEEHERKLRADIEAFAKIVRQIGLKRS